MPEASARVRALAESMTLEEKLAQLTGYWLDQGGNVVAPMQSEMASGQRPSGQLAEVTRDGIGHFTRVYGTRPVDAVERAHWLWTEQRRLKRETRLGIPALVHEEILTGLAAWKATTFPTPLAWGASFDPDLVEEAGAAIGASMAALGIHQGLAPVLDVIQDPRWGRVDECIGEDPYLVGTVATAFVRGVQSRGVHATLKHFLSYSGSAAGRNHAPVHAGPREILDIFLPPFEMAIHDGGARSVMNSYTAIDGVPVASDPAILTDLLRGTLGFDGVVVADYFAVAFLQVMQGVAATRGEAARLALTAGIDIELPTGDAYLAPLAQEVRSGRLDEAYVDRAVLRALAQKEELGLLEPDAFETEPPSVVDLDPIEHQLIARRLAEHSIILLSNDGTLPLAGPQPPATVAIIGPNADRTAALQGCYSFANHVLAAFPDVEVGIAIPTVAEALAGAFAAVGVPIPTFSTAEGCAVEGEDRAGFAEAIAVTKAADVAVVVVGDQAGLFGRGTVGEGNDTQTLELPGVQRELVDALVATGTPVVMVVITGRPYAIGWALDGPGPRPAAVLQSFFPGEGGGLAIADVLTGAVNPSGRLPVSLPRSGGAQPYSYLQPILGGASEVTSTDPTPVRPFGFGLSYTRFGYSELTTVNEVAAGEHFPVEVTVTNTGERSGTEIVQLYGRDLVGSVVRPVVQLLGYTRVELEPGQSRRIRFDVPTARFAFSDRSLRKIVEPGDVEVWVGSHCAASANQLPSVSTTNGAISNSGLSIAEPVAGTATTRAAITVTGEVHPVGLQDARLVRAEVIG
jgi:Beta-glucosidase-related glycosidases